MKHLPHNQRGSALVISLMVIFAMTGLGAIAFNTAVTSTRSATNFSDQKQAEFAAETAVTVGVQFLECNLPVLLRFAEEGSGFYQFEQSDPVGCAASTDETFFGSHPFGRDEQTPFFRVRYEDFVPARRAANYDDAFCYMRVNMAGEGGLNDTRRAGANVRVTRDEMGGAQISREFAGQFLVGPVKCPNM